jgi:uncharacterized protein
VLVPEDGPRLFDVAPPAPEVLPEMQTGWNLLEMLRQAPQSLDWFYLSPLVRFGAWEPQVVKGSYRTSDDILLRTRPTSPTSRPADLARAVVDEIEQPRHRRRRFHVAH